MHAYTFMGKDVECTTNELNPTTVLVPLYSLMISKITFLLSNRKFVFKNIYSYECEYHVGMVRNYLF